MKKLTVSLGALCLSLMLAAQQPSPAKQAVINSIENQKTSLIQMSDEIWALAEIALVETESSKILADYARENGMTVEMGVAGMPTAFTATYGSGKPVIGILGEFDALPGLSQKTTPTKQPLEEGAAGHGCGHNMFGPGSLGAGSSHQRAHCRWHPAGNGPLLRDTGRRKILRETVLRPCRTIRRSGRLPRLASQRRDQGGSAKFQSTGRLHCRVQGDRQLTLRSTPGTAGRLSMAWSFSPPGSTTCGNTCAPRYVSTTRSCTVVTW